jgi:hypothetical protein
VLLIGCVKFIRACEPCGLILRDQSVDGMFVPAPSAVCQDGHPAMHPICSDAVFLFRVVSSSTCNESLLAAYAAMKLHVLKIVVQAPTSVGDLGSMQSLLVPTVHGAAPGAATLLPANREQSSTTFLQLIPKHSDWCSAGMLPAQSADCMALYRAALEQFTRRKRIIPQLELSLSSAHTRLVMQAYKRQHHLYCVIMYEDRDMLQRPHYLSNIT